MRGRALHTETKVESVTSQSKSGTSVNLSNSGFRGLRGRKKRLGIDLVRVLAGFTYDKGQVGWNLGEWGVGAGD